MKALNIFNRCVVLFFIFTHSLLADGLIIIPRPEPLQSPYPLEVLYHHVNVKINGNIAETFIDQEFHNPSDVMLEGYYIFPIPKNAVIKNFSMEINGKMVAAELLDANKARQIYEDIVRQIKDPALLEYTGQGIFKVRIFPIEPRSNKKVSISYREILDSDNGIYEYVYPLNTEKFSAKPVKSVSVKVDLKTNNKIKTIYSPTHSIDVAHKDNKNAVVSFEEENTKPDIDFKLYYSTNNDDVGLSLLTYKTGNDDGYFFLTASPSFIVNNNQIDSKDITFVLDVSGSMVGDKMKQAKQALLYCINNLNKDDGFDIIRFSTEAYALFGRTEPASESNIKKAEKFIKELNAVGGTNIEEALNLALKEKRNADRTRIIVFMTDGKPTIGETNDESLIKKLIDSNTKNVRIFTFGIGNDLNTHLLDKITEQTKAYRTYISENEDIEIKISGFYDKVQSPVLTNLSLSFNGNVKTLQTYPKDLPDMFKGSSITIFGRYSGSGSSDIKLEGMIKGERKSFYLKADFTNDNEQYRFHSSTLGFEKNRLFTRSDKTEWRKQRTGR